MHQAERDRLRALDAYSILDTDPDPTYDSLARSAATLLGTSAAAITFVDSRRWWAKAVYGPGLRQMPREWAICNDVVATEQVLAIDDLRADSRHAANPIVTGIRGVRSYAGAPLIGRDGLPLGTLCVMDEEVRRFGDAELGTLTALAEAVVALLEARRNDLETGRVGRGTQAGIDPARLTPSGIRHALQRGEFEAHYQPIVSIPNGTLTGVEALARWNLPGVGLLGPQHFLPHIEASPLLSHAFTQHMLTTACRDLARWRALGGEQLGLSVNVSGYEVTGGRLPLLVSAAVRGSGVPYDCLTIEITETVNLHNRRLAISHLNRLRNLGVRVSLDDFGVGYSSLEHAGSLPITGLKLDRDFVLALHGSAAMNAALASVVLLCKTLHLELVGEGVENQAAADHLVAAGVPLAQGFHFSRPVPAAAITTMLHADGQSAEPVALPFRQPVVARAAADLELPTPLSA